MGDGDKTESTEWRDQIAEIAHGWLFSDIPPGDFPGQVILPLENPDLHNEEHFVSLLTHRKKFKTLTVGRYGGQLCGVMASKFGSPAVAMTVELLAAAGVRMIVGVGYCGRLDGQIECGDIVLPSGCIRNEGTTSHYVEPTFPAVPDLGCVDQMRVILRQINAKWHSGVVWTTDAVLRETSERVEYWKGAELSQWTWSPLPS